MFDSVKFLLDRIGIRMTSEGVRIAAMRELRNAYAESMGDPNSEVMSLIVPYVLGNGYASLDEYMALMGVSCMKSKDQSRSWGDAVALQWVA